MTDRTNQTGKGEVIWAGLEPLLPEEIHGFSVEIFAGPYPLDNRASHRRAVYARLKPTTPENQRKLAKIGRTMILGEAQLEADTATLLYAGQLHEDALEALATAALEPAAALARQVEAAA